MLELTANLVRPGQAVLAFNVISLEHAEAILAGAERAGRPVILQLSQNAIGYHRSAAALSAACVALAEEAAVPASIHFDHIETMDLVHAAARGGASSVMFDASTRSDEENQANTAAAAEWAHEHGLFVEAELGAVGGKGGAHTPGVRTDPAEAAAFVRATGVDALAVAVGSSHAMTERSGSLDLDLIRRLRDAVPVPLVLHGSSGIPDEVLRAAVAAGIVKINIGTLLNVSFTIGVRQALTDPAMVDPRRYLGAGREAITDAVLHCYKAIL